MRVAFLARVGERLAIELLAPRTLPWFLLWPLRVLAVLVLLWGIAVCVTITLAFAAALLDF